LRARPIRPKSSLCLFGSRVAVSIDCTHRRTRGRQGGEQFLNPYLSLVRSGARPARIRRSGRSRSIPIARIRPVPTPSNFAERALNEVSRGPYLERGQRFKIRRWMSLPWRDRIDIFRISLPIICPTTLFVNRNLFGLGTISVHARSRAPMGRAHLRMHRRSEWIPTTMKPSRAAHGDKAR